MKQAYPSHSLGTLCGLFGYTRQAYYKRRSDQERQAFESAVVIDLVKSVRQDIPRLGGKKLYHILKPQLIGHRIKLGRDKFFAILRAHELLIRIRKRRALTTWSKHGLRIYPNLIKELTPLRANELWVSDITYIRVGSIWNYVIFITDAYSHVVVGHHVEDHMRAEFCKVALDQALSQWQEGSTKLIHHSDRGLQYCSALYTNKLRQNKIRISMTQFSDPYENAVAERVNGIFKTDFLMDQTFANLEEARMKIQKMVYHYNYTRPHLSCDMLTPAQAHQQEGPLPKRW